MKNLLFRTGLVSPAADWGLLLLRLGVGLLMIIGHGYGKVGRVLAGNMQFGDPLGLGPGTSLVLAAFAEFVCSLAVILGLMTRAAVIPLIVTMSTAALIVHADDPFGKQELPLLFLSAYVLLLLTGPGKLSLDAFIGRKLGVNTK
ncbi:MAG: DoxX family protein [candidate division Zixibacteria bacterium]|jgi:putative oxidoreductase|nr:DoxX family protein [candidate division Zixibacteria bacterium]